jgi:hypothetical protein
MNFPENAIQQAIAEYLKLNKIFFFHIPNERKSSARDMVRLKKMGLVPGVADLEVWFPKKGINKAALYSAMEKGIIPSAPSLLVDIGYIEVKAQGGKQTENQVIFEKYCKIAGLDYRVVFSVDEVAAILKERGIIGGKI